MAFEDYGPGEVVAFGEAIYQERIRHLVEPTTENGKFVVIDIESGDYEIDAEDP